MIGLTKDRDHNLTRREFLTWLGSMGLIGGIAVLALGVPGAIRFFQWFGANSPADVNGQLEQGQNKISVSDILPEQTVLEKYSDPRPEAFGRILRLAENGKNVSGLFFEAAKSGEAVHNDSDVVLLELEYMEEYASLKNKQIRDKLLDAYAEGIVTALKETYGTEDKIAVALEPGHWSVPSNNAKLGINPTYDTGTASNGLNEKEANYDVCSLVMKKIANQPLPWIPIIVSTKSGFEVDQIRGDRATSEDKYVIDRVDSVLPLVWRWEQLAHDLSIQDIKMARLCVHFNSPPQDLKTVPKGGMVYWPDFGKHRDGSKSLAVNLVTALSTVVKNVKPDYAILSKGDDYYLDGNPPYWYLSSTDSDDPEDIRNGNYKNVLGLPNRVVAWLRAKDKEGNKLMKWYDMLHLHEGIIASR